MEKTNLIPLEQIRVLSATPVLSETLRDNLAVTFSVGNMPFHFVVHISKKHFLDDNIVRIAQHFLHMQADRLAQSTSTWRLSTEDFDEIVARGKASQNIAPEPSPS